MLGSLSAQPNLSFSCLAETQIRCPTAGQRGAISRLQQAVDEGEPLVLLFGDTGSGKTALLNHFCGSLDLNRFRCVLISGPGADAIGPPTFEYILSSICRSLAPEKAPEQRPALLANLGSAVKGISQQQKSLIIGIDHADNLTDDVIADLVRLHVFIEVLPSSILRVFVGSLALASRIDAVLRRMGAGHRLAEIRLSQPTGEELATVLAYEDSAHPGGPMLTPGAIERISVYAKSNLQWAVPLADAARIFAENAGLREVTPELVQKALLDIWSPEGPITSASGLSDAIAVDALPLAAGTDPGSALRSPAQGLSAPAIRRRRRRMLLAGAILSGLGALAAVRYHESATRAGSPANENRQVEEKSASAYKDDTNGGTPPSQGAAMPSPDGLTSEPPPQPVGDADAKEILNSPAPPPADSPSTSKTDASGLVVKPPARKTVRRVSPPPQPSQDETSEVWPQTR